MRLEVGPVEPASAAAWIQWVEETLREPSLGSQRLPLPDQAVADVRDCVEQFRTGIRSLRGTFRWTGEIDPDQLEYLVHAFVSLDSQVSDGVRRGERSAAPDEARDFHLVLVHSLLHTLENDGPARAAFVDQLRWSWPTAVAAA